MFLILLKSLVWRLRYWKVWKGVYPSFNAIPASARAESFDDPSALQAAYLSANDQRRRYQRSGVVVSKSEHSLLAFLAANILHKDRPLSILDIGGGMGTAYLDLSASGSVRSIRYQVMERPSVCEWGKKLWSDDEISFVSDWSEVKASPDIIHISTALQYFTDYREVIRHAKASGAAYVLFTRLSAGNIPTFATVQRNMLGGLLPYWFLSLKELLGLMQPEYEKVYEGRMRNYYDMSNFPDTHRLADFVHLLFHKKDLK